jgi:hypothetical protein
MSSVPRMSSTGVCAEPDVVICAVGMQGFDRFIGKRPNRKSAFRATLGAQSSWVRSLLVHDCALVHTLRRSARPACRARPNWFSGLKRFGQSIL